MLCRRTLERREVARREEAVARRASALSTDESMALSVVPGVREVLALPILSLSLFLSLHWPLSWHTSGERRKFHKALLGQAPGAGGASIGGARVRRQSRASETTNSRPSSALSSSKKYKPRPLPSLSIDFLSFLVSLFSLAYSFLSLGASSLSLAGRTPLSGVRLLCNARLSHSLCRRSRWGR
jgi:hypothetical protein